MSIVEKLRNEHQTLVAALGTVDSSKIGTEEGNEVLFNIKSALLQHLKHEDDEFYPLLKDAALTDAELAKTLNTFEKDMEKISAAALDFFEKYTSTSSSETFKEDFGLLVENLAQRIAMEEEVLFAAHDKIKNP